MVEPQVFFGEGRLWLDLVQVSWANKLISKKALPKVASLRRSMFSLSRVVVEVRLALGHGRGRAVRNSHGTIPRLPGRYPKLLLDKARVCLLTT